jgi:hypothetical protein
METMHQAISRLERRGFSEAFHATRGGELQVDDAPPLAPEFLVIEEMVRFEGESDPEDEAVLFALSSQDGRVHGTFVASFGTPSDAASAEAIQRLARQRRRGRQIDEAIDD